MKPLQAIRSLNASPATAWLLSDETLADLLLRNATVSRVHAVLDAERLFRWWILHRLVGSATGQAAASFKNVNTADPDGLRFFSELQAEYRLNALDTQGQPLREDNHALDRSRHFRARARNHLDAHGFIPLVHGSHACSVPFRFVHAYSDRWRFIAATGHEVARQWNDCANELGEVVPEAPWQIHLGGVFPKEIEFEGGSFGLPVAIAAHLRSFTNFDPLSLVATGAIEGGRLTGVQRCDLKREMAVRQGAKLFVCPESGLAEIPKIRTVQIPCGTPWNELRHHIEEELRHLGLLSMNAAQAADLIRSLQKLGVSGHGCPDVSIPQITRAITTVGESLETGMEKFPNRIHQLLRSAKLHLASLHSHSGNPGAAREVLNQLLPDENAPRERCTTAARMIVALSDEGRFQEALLIAEDALVHADRIPDGHDQDLLAKMEIHGALGGDLFLQLALRKGPEGGSKDSERSKEHLETNLLLSEELLHANLNHFLPTENLAKSATRSVLWHALFDPERTEQKVSETREQFGRRPGWQTSEPYLRRIRFLGEYRRRIFANGTSDLMQWEDELPSTDPDRSGSAWIRAMALKYRGAIRALDLRPEEALRDFEEARHLLAGEQPKVFRLLRWSVEAEALCSLPEVPPTTLEILDRDRMPAVEYLAAYEPSIELAQRIKSLRFEDRTAGDTLGVLREFLRGFAY